MPRPLNQFFNFYDFIACIITGRWPVGDFQFSHASKNQSHPSIRGEKCDCNFMRILTGMRRFDCIKLIDRMSKIV